ncbi:MAG: hypothetical protein JWR60_586 [Polaromonas sp.]|nr:hypothetical protein [Polaromonas sp.]
MHTSHMARRVAIAVLAGAASLLAVAQDRPLPVASPPGPGASAAAMWRAASRLGYALTPQEAAPVSETASRLLALQQIDAAYEASRQAPRIPTELARVNAPMSEIVSSYQAEREARKELRAQTSLPGAARAALPADQAFSREMAQSAAAWRLVSCSNPAIENQLLARMTEFWFNHLNVYDGKGTVRPFVGHYLVNVIRANALGRFEDLLLASARHPAMLYYLDQAQSNSRGLNENYARELMELHTLGVGGGYGQNDVHELARILTGWSFNLQGGEGFRFNERQHDKGSKVFLGQSYASDGVKEGEDAIRHLARKPATAHRVAARLATFFVADKPSPALVEQLAGTFLATQGDIRAVMQALVASPEFWAAGNQLFKTPMDFACSALTAAGGVRDRRDVAQALGFLSQAGQPVNGWQTPDGYKTDAATWLAPEALTRRADFAMGLAERMPEPVYLNAFFTPATQALLAREPARQRAGLMLASPDFMRK